MPIVAAVVGLGGAAVVADQQRSAAGYTLLGDIATERAVTPQALQAWHIAGAEFGGGTGLALFLVGAALAGIVADAVPGWLAWSALLLGLGQFAPHPWGFWASMLALRWSLVTGIVLAGRPSARDAVRDSGSGHPATAVSGGRTPRR